jgi:hypothetical protein
MSERRRRRAKPDKHCKVYEEPTGLAARLAHDALGSRDGLTFHAFRNFFKRMMMIGIAVAGEQFAIRSQVFTLVKFRVSPLFLYIPFPH